MNRFFYFFGNLKSKRSVFNNMTVLALGISIGLTTVFGAMNSSFLSSIRAQDAVTFISLPILTVSQGTDSVGKLVSDIGKLTHINMDWCTKNGGYFKVGKTYRINGATYHPKKDYNYSAEGTASWYGPGFHNKKTANGETFDMHGISAAHKTLQMPCMVRVTNLENGKEVVARVNDRGPYHSTHNKTSGKRLIDLSLGAAKLLGFHEKGTARVRVEVLSEESQLLEKVAKGENVSNKEIKVASLSQKTTSLN
ncbi:MAG: septal ring lytic transglycosylase RlpA family protein [Alphaproteobacteria bacterium]|jgi:rare lipoprotein A (peptidoglycan hydrolase)|nr:septal ring lytic transglycosylase RlpA family protein [Alphaproteobacteria bacterium]